VALGPDWLVSVLPDVALISRGMPATELCRDVLALFARMLALAWQAEAVSLPALALDDYRQAKDAFQREWLSALLDRHGGNRSSAAVSSGLSRARLHQLIRTFSLENRHAPSADDAVRDR